MSEFWGGVLYCTDGWVWSRVLDGTLPEIMYIWHPWAKALEKQASGEMVIVGWTEPKTGAQYWISHEEMPDALLVVYKAQWDEATSGSKGRILH